MKRISLCILLACLTLAATAQTEVKSHTQKVTLYPSGAQIEKSVTVNLKKGENQLVIHGNASCIQSGSVNFASSSDWFVSSIREELVTQSLRDLLPAAAYDQYLALQNQLDETELKIKNASLLIATLDKQQQALGNLKAVTNPGAFDSIDKVKAQFEYQRKESQNINTTRAKTQHEFVELVRKRDQLQEVINKLKVKHLGYKPIKLQQEDIIVNIYSAKAIANATIAYSYRATESWCSYSYDVMMDEQQQRAIFTLKAEVTQNTGESWADCPLVFSTSDASYAGFDSELPTYTLDLNRYTPRVRTMAKGKAMTQAALARNMVTTDEVEMAECDLSLSQIANNLSLTREYALNTRQGLYPDHTARTIPIHVDTTKALFARFATPKNEEKVHYTALLPDWESLGLLEVGCNVYVDNRFVSTSDVVTAGSGDTLRFSVGQDPNVLVSRKHSLSTPDKSVLSKEVSRTVTVTLTLKNTRQQAVEVRMKDQVPLSGNVDIKVTDINTAGGTLNDKTGIIRWVVPMQPLEQKTITFSYTVKYPKEMEGQLTLN